METEPIESSPLPTEVTVTPEMMKDRYESDPHLLKLQKRIEKQQKILDEKKAIVKEKNAVLFASISENDKLITRARNQNLQFRKTIGFNNARLKEAKSLRIIHNCTLAMTSRKHTLNKAMARELAILKRREFAREILGAAKVLREEKRNETSDT